MSIKFFISYADSDRNKMESLKKAIKSIDEEYETIIVTKRRLPGQPLSKKVERGIDESTFFVPILTKKSISSQWVNQEIGYANAKEKIPLPIIEGYIRNKLKGFIHSQMDLPFYFDSDRNDKRKEASNFRRCYKERIRFIQNSVEKFEFESQISPFRVKQGKMYTTKVKFGGRLNYGFFENYVVHLNSNWTTWNWDKNTLDNIGNGTPGKLSGNVNIESEYKWSTESWPIGKYRIYVRVYDHINPGIPGRVLITEQVHDFEVV